MSRNFARDAAVLVVGGLIGAGALHVAQVGPSAVGRQALSLYAGLMGGEGHAHAEGQKQVAAKEGHKDGDGHAHGESEKGHAKDDGHGHGEEDDHSRGDGHDHGSGKDDGHGHGADDGHGHDKRKADASAPTQVAAKEDHRQGDGHAHGEGEKPHAKDDGHGHDEKDDGHGHGPGKDDGHGHGADDEHGHEKPKTDKPKADAAAPQKVAAVDVKDDGHGHGAELPEGVVELGDAKIKAAGIGLGKAGPSTLREELQLNGVVQPNQEAVVQVTPRFPGIVRTLSKRLGDEVKKGDLLAVIESNQSLTTYELRAPMAGVITERQASLGEYVSEQKPAFVVTDLSTLWVDFSVYRRDLAKVKAGETVRIDPEDGADPIEATISYLSPIGAADTQSAVARAVIRNDGRFRPGLFATGAVATAETAAPLAVSLDAIQSFEGRDVVFVRDGDRFSARDVTLGRRDARSVEIVSGMKAGDVYAAKNSFVVKAELGKSEAGHEH